MQFYDLTQTSLTKSGSSVVESYIPLWQSDGTSVQFAAGTSLSSPQWLIDGSSSTNGLSTNTAARLHTLNANWSPTQQFAFEVTMYLYQTPNTDYAGLWDFTSGSLVSASQVSTTSTTAAVYRSGKFTLTPGHVYGVTSWSTSTASYIIDASLIVFGQ